MSVPTYTPSSGDHVVVTRSAADGRTRTCTGAIHFAGDFTPDTGFDIDGCGPHASANAVHGDYGVTQTIRPADQDDA